MQNTEKVIVYLGEESRAEFCRTLRRAGGTESRELNRAGLGEAVWGLGWEENSDPLNPNHCTALRGFCD